MILWVRHGQSTWNVIDRMQGHELSPPLTQRGREQAGYAAEQLSQRGAIRLLSSPAVRAQQTATIIAARLGLQVETEPLLLEKGLDENYTHLLLRVQQLLERDLPDHTIVVSHGDIIGLALGLLSGQRPELVANGSISSVSPETGEVTIAVPPQ